jgi:hypothetical protein
MCPTKTMINSFLAIVGFLQTYNGAVTATATVFIAAFTIVLALVTIAQARLTRDAVNPAREEFTSSQRPQLRVRNFVVSHPLDESALEAPLFTAGKRLKCQFFASNVGGTNAEITEAFAIIFLNNSSGLPMQRPYEGMKGNVSPLRRIVAPGQSTDDKELGQHAGSIGVVTTGSRQHLFVMGWIKYKDERNLVRRTAFCREYESGRFKQVGNPDYEHEE